jgi:hypothetical protein
MNPVNKRRDLVVLSALIEYPGVGLILFETGCAEDLEVVRTLPHLNPYYLAMEYIYVLRCCNRNGPPR